MMWRWCLLAFCCWPVLLWQGKRVRAMALRLPEAAGARSGTSGQGSPLRLLICGDSAAAGVGIEQQEQALAGQLVRQLEKNYQVQWQLHAQTGLDTSRLLDLLHRLPCQAVDAVVVSIGVNDVTSLCSNHRFSQQLKALLDCLDQRFDQPLVLFSAIPPMQHFTALPTPLNRWLGLKAAMLNCQMNTAIKAHPRAQVVNTAFPLTESVLAADGFHPSATGSQLWATALKQQLSARLANRLKL
ncbi:MAG: SGNH/GDSL hydrolase family protein [Alkalimonas sp.]|nr:SGNH/GDSL hydrolase family protein [Alkalimonas sp.]